MAPISIDWEGFRGKQLFQLFLPPRLLQAWDCWITWKFLNQVSTNRNQANRRTADTQLYKLLNYTTKASHSFSWEEKRRKCWGKHGNMSGSKFWSLCNLKSEKKSERFVQKTLTLIIGEILGEDNRQCVWIVPPNCCVSIPSRTSWSVWLEPCTFRSCFGSFRKSHAVWSTIWLHVCSLSWL